MEIKTFRNISMDQFERIEWDDAHPENSGMVSDVKPGLEFYAVEVFFENTGQERLDARSEPATYNMTGKPCINGWAGTTNNVNVSGVGQWRITKVIKRRNAEYSLYDIEAERIQ